LAYWPGPPGQPEKERGLMMLWARSPPLLTGLLDRLEQAAKQAGNPSLRAFRSHRDVTYNAWDDGKRPSFTYQSGALFAISHQEDVLRQLIDRERSAARPDTAMARQLRRLGLEDSVAALWFNPRTFDAELERITAHRPGIDAGLRSAVLAHWKAFEGAA